MQRKLIRRLSGWSLAWMASSVYALGLGDIELRSGLSQPFMAEIPLLSATEEDLASARVTLASNDEFDRAGLDRGLYAGLLKFEIEAPAGGQAYVKVFSSKPVEEPFLDFLVVIEWPSGRLVREYTVLLDPPVTMGAGFQRSESSPRSAAAEPQEKSDTVSKPSSSAGGARRSIVRIDPNAAPPAFNAAGEVSVQRNDTLWRIANRVKPDASVSTDQMMVALLRANPQAFVNGDMDRLRAGATLQVPAQTDIAALAEGVPGPAPVAATEPSAEAPSQEVAEPTPIEPVAAEPAPSPTPAPTPSAEEQKRLTLETPKPGATGEGGGSGAANAELEAQLALAKEEAEVERNKNEELNKRLAELEAQMKRFEDMVALKNQELAAIQNRLATEPASGEATATPPGEVPAPAPEATSPAEPAAPQETAEVPSEPVAEPPVVETPVSTGEAPVEAVAPEVAAPEVSPPEAPAPESAPSETVAEVPVEATPAEPEAAAPGDAVPVEPPLVTAEPVPVPQLPPEEPVLEAKPEPAPEPVPFWQQPYFLGGALLGIAGLLGAGLFALRRRQMESEYAEGAVETLVVEPAEPTVKPVAPAEKKPVAAPAPAKNKADATVVPPPAPAAVATHHHVSPSAHDGMHVGDHSPLEEADVYLAYGQYQQAAEVIKHAMERESTGIEYRFKLVQIYAAMKDRASFIEEAESLQIAAADEHPEIWEKAVALGRELCPDHALFREGGEPEPAESSSNEFVGNLDLGLGNNSLASAFEAVQPSASSADAPKNDLDFSLDFDAPAADATRSPLPNGHGGLDFSLDFEKSASAPAAPAAPAANTGSLDFLTAFERVDATAESKPSSNGIQFPSLDMEAMPSLFSKDSQPLDDLSMDVGDEVGTKLDLARAYIDMGDDEGARSILDEVMQEGTSAQKQEAQKILAQIH